MPGLIEHTTVMVDGRRFIVTFNTGVPVRIKGRLTANAGHPYLSYIYNRQVWQVSQPLPASPSAMPNRILEAVKTKPRSPEAAKLRLVFDRDQETKEHDNA